MRELYGNNTLKRGGRVRDRRAAGAGQVESGVSSMLGETAAAV